MALGMQHVTFPDRRTCPALGLGTWRMGESQRERAAEVAAVRLALDIGHRIIDTAEMYGDGGAEEVVGQALAEATFAWGLSRDEVFVVSKVCPHNASRDRVRAAWTWTASTSTCCTGAASTPWHRQSRASRLRSHGDTSRWGASNFDVDDKQELAAVGGGAACASNQAHYSFGERAPSDFSAAVNTEP